MAVMIVEEEGTVLGMNLGRPIVNNGDGDTLFQNYIGRTCFFLILRVRTAQLGLRINDHNVLR